MLDERSKQVLFAVIQSYINTAGPVGSRAVTKKYPFGLSPATIRNIMSDLEEVGLLKQPHTSAGRVPTDTGYRYYVDSLAADKHLLSADFVNDLGRRLESLRKDMNLFLDDAARMLSVMTHYLGITISPGAGATTLERMELIKYRSDQVVVVLFTDEGIVRNMVVQSDPELTQDNLNRIAGYINAHYSGLALDEIRQRILDEMMKERDHCDSLIEEAMRICRDVFSSSPGNVHMSGLSGLLNLPDFCDVTRIKELMSAIEDKHIMVGLLDRIAETEGPRIFIGSENPLDEMKKFSIVAATYREGSRPVGAIAIIGPTRMDYANAISIVDMTAAYITDMLSGK